MESHPGGICPVGSFPNKWGVVLVGSRPGGSCPVGSRPGRESSGWELSSGNLSVVVMESFPGIPGGPKNGTVDFSGLCSE